MVTDIRPPGVKTAKKSTIRICPAFVDPAHPTVAELTTNALKFECYLLPGQFQPSVTDNVDLDARYCDDQVFGTFGDSTWSIGNLVYIYDPTQAGTVAGNKAFGMLAKGNSVFLADRDGLDIGTEIIAAQILTAIYPIECGTQLSTPIADNSGGGGGQTSKFTITQQVVINGTVLQFVPVVA